MARERAMDSIVTALRRAFADLDYDEFEDFKCEEYGSELHFAYHCGEAGGMAAAAGLFGAKSLELCDDISDAWECNDQDFLLHLLSGLIDLAKRRHETYGKTRASGLDWEALGAALDDAMRSRDQGDDMRYHLMIGFVAGLMFNHPGPPHDSDEVATGIIDYCAANDPETVEVVKKRLAEAIGDEGTAITFRDGIIRGYDTGCIELIEWARAGIDFGVQMSGPTGALSGEEVARVYDARVRTMRWAQNFGLRNARAKDGSVSVPKSMYVTYWQAKGAAADAEEPEWEEYEVVEFGDEGDDGRPSNCT